MGFYKIKLIAPRIFFFLSLCRLGKKCMFDKKKIRRTISNKLLRHVSRSFLCKEHGCRNRGRFHAVCEPCAMKKYGVVVKPSGIADGGMGLFAARRLELNHHIPYGGRKPVVAKTVKNRYPGGAKTLAPYVLRLENGMYLDAHKYRGFGSMANDGLDHSPANAIYCPSCGGVVISTVVEEGEEIFVSYGPEFWIR